MEGVDGGGTTEHEQIEGRDRKECVKKDERGRKEKVRRRRKENMKYIKGPMSKKGDGEEGLDDKGAG